MHYTHDLTQANEYAGLALERMHKEGLAPTPDNFELWYVYYSRLHPDVIRALDILAANKQRITDERCKELHQRFLGPSHSEEKIRRAGEQLHTAIRDVSSVVSNVKNATSQYSGTLETVTGRLADVDRPEDLRTIVRSIVDDTEKMIEHNRSLEEQLDRSTKAMISLQRDLETIRREAMTDGLTGLSNRKAFDEEIKRIAHEADEAGKSFVLLMVDIDHFKSFNDNFGHQVGDQVLRLVARTLVEGVKGRDIAARYGGEEFAILLPETELRAGVAVGENLRKALFTKDIINRSTGEKLGRITMSVGVAEYCNGEILEDLIERADAALYTAKHNGRNQVAAAPTPGKKSKRE